MWLLGCGKRLRDIQVIELVRKVREMMIRVIVRIRGEKEGLSHLRRRGETGIELLRPLDGSFGGQG